MAIAAAGVCSLAALLLSSEARAQSATPLERYAPTPIGDALFASPSVTAGGYFALDTGLVFSFANAPLVLRTETSSGANGDELGALVGHQAVLHFMASAALFSRLKVDLDLPMTVDQGGDSPTAPGGKIASPSGFAMNDIRLGARFTALDPTEYLPGVAIAFSAFVPTGNSDAYTSTGNARFEPRLIIGADYGRVFWSASVARQLGDSTSGLFGSDVNFSAGIAARFGRFQVGPEIFGHSAVDRAAPKDGGVTLSKNAGGGLEALLGAKAAFGPATVGAAGALGFNRGVGVPDFRFILSVAIHPFEEKAPPPETEPVSTQGSGPSGQPDKGTQGGTGSPTVQAPVQPAVPVDTDGDTVLDAEDACPKLVGDPRPDATKRGCPPDKDGDGIYDVDDKCPDRPGVYAEGDKNGCPPDSDGDTIVDPDDACPAEAGPKTSDPKTNGCPESVRVEGTQIVILQQVNFETAKAVILPGSFPLLKQVSDVLKSHPEIARLAVDGHTDNRGSETSNLDLSRARAVSVMRWLVNDGIDARRLEARGFGPRRPVADNKTDAGRAKNRRVEFQIRKKTDKGEAGWVDGPID
ncbi:MAG: OmpA family protein [Polyangiaceae bacterium]|nr:OmpA family protein [Polyangiaceae bacterium]